MCRDLAGISGALVRFMEVELSVSITDGRGCEKPRSSANWRQCITCFAVLERITYSPSCGCKETPFSFAE